MLAIVNQNQPVTLILCKYEAKHSAIGRLMFVCRNIMVFAAITYIHSTRTLRN